MENSKFKENIFPALVLFCICLGMALALAGIHSIAQPKIDANQAKADNESRMLVLSEGDSFTPYDGKLSDGVVECYMADNKAGMVVTSEHKGFSGAVTVMTGIDANGAITGVTVTKHAETPGLGTKAAEPDYLAQYIGVTEADKAHIRDDANIDAISGATITSNAVYGSVVKALKQFKECGGVK